MIVLAAAQAAGQTGSWAALVAALPLALQRRDPASWLALVNAAWAGPAMLSQLAGPAIDRYGPRITGSMCWLGAAACAIACCAARDLPALLVPLGLMSAFRGCGVAAGDTAPTWLPRPPDLARAGSCLVVAAAVPVLAGPLGSATLLAHADASAAWLAAAVLLGVAATGSMTVPARRPAPAPSPDTRSAPAGQRRSSGSLAVVLAITAGVWLSYGALEILQPLYVRQVLHASLSLYAWTMTAFALGGTAGALLTAGVRGKLPQIRVPAAALAVAAGERIFTATSSPATALAGAAAWGAAAAVFSVTSRTAILSAAPAHRHGQALSTWRAVQSAAGVAPAAITGTLTTAIGLPATLTATCCLASGTGVIALAAALHSRAAKRGNSRAGSRQALPAAPCPGAATQPDAEADPGGPGQGTLAGRAPAR
ncbi:MAG TPA: MFS transporter [Streptosporangiaceae bacterium]|jgi:MFS family permease